MKLATDACSLINLDSGGVFANVLNLPGFEWNVGPLVVQECGALQALQDAIDAQKIVLLDDGLLGVETFMSLRRKYRLGPGETECIAFATTLGVAVCTDDRRAREAVVAEIGATRLVGTIGLLKRCVMSGIMTSSAAFEAYGRMLAAGAFLPAMTAADFA